MPTITTTLQAIRDAKPCRDGYMKLRRHLGMKFPMGKRFNVLRVLESNGPRDADWVLEYVCGQEGARAAGRALAAALRYRHVEDWRDKRIRALRHVLSPSRKKKPAKRPAQQRRAA